MQKLCQNVSANKRKNKKASSTASDSCDTL